MGHVSQQRKIHFWRHVQGSAFMQAATWSGIGAHACHETPVSKASLGSQNITGMLASKSY